jgi:ABC-type nitrate/sulfonate/bicarbonate transport system permease component
VVNARYGLGYLITTAGKRSHVDQIFALVLVILFIGVVTDWMIRFVNVKLFHWNAR